MKRTEEDGAGAALSDIPANWAARPPDGAPAITVGGGGAPGGGGGAGDTTIDGALN